MKVRKDQYIIYPGHGIGQIKKVLKSNGSNGKSYEIHLIDAKVVIKIPEKSFDSVNMRNIIEEDRVEHVIDKLSDEKDTIQEKDWKKKALEISNKIRNGTCEDLVYVIKDLFIKNINKSLSIVERKKYELCFNTLSREIAISTNESVSVVETIILEKLEKLKENLKLN